MPADPSDPVTVYGFDFDYLLWTAACWVVLLLLLVGFLWSGIWRSTRLPGRLSARLFLIFWPAVTLLAVLEITFALGYDTTDSFGLLLSSKRWYRRHVVPNRSGFRDTKEFTRTPPPGRRRIALLGDSFTFGHGIADPAARFGDILERRMGKAFPDRFELHNAALPGLGTGHQLELLQQWRDMGYQTNSILLVYVMNDIEDLVPEHSSILGTIIATQSPWLFRHSYLGNFLYVRFGQFTRAESQNPFSWLADAYRDDTWTRQRERLDRLRHWCDARDIQLAVVVFPFLHQIGVDYEFRAAHRIVEAYWRENNVPFLDLLATMEQHQQEGLTVNRFDAHPNERAHALAAEEIWESLVSGWIESSDR